MARAARRCCDEGVPRVDDAELFTRYPRFAELTETLQRWAARWPRWCRLESLGQRPEGRALWLMTVGDRVQGDPDERPALWIDGNIHAGEVIGSVVCLKTIHSLVTRAEAAAAAGPADGAEPSLLATNTFYVRPRVSPDGAELYLTTPHRLRSAPIEWPRRREPAPGIHPADVDGDGHITTMRLPDPNGEWRVSELDPRVMVRRTETDRPSTAYRLYPEGVVEGEVRLPLPVAPPRWGLDYNRSHPHNWQPEHRQSGAGPYPLHPIETRVNVDFILAHPNIGMVVSYHTHGGFCFRLPSSAPLSAYRHGDLTGDYAALCRRFTELTGGPVFQSYDEATGTARYGSLMDWAYNQHGLYGWVPELWNVWGEAGIDRGAAAAEYFGERGEADQVRLLEWADRELGPDAFVPWHEVDHPQLGRVEVGGWTFKYTHQNPPGRFIPRLADAHIAWTDYLARCLPRLALGEPLVEVLDGGISRVRVRVANTAFLPTNLSQQAIDVRQADPVRVELRLEGGATVLDGAPTRTIGHLAGRRLRGGRIWDDPRPSANAVDVAWLVRGPVAGRIVATSAKAGRAEVPLG